MTLGQRQGYNVDPKNAAILNEARYLSGDGSFGSAYQQEDGVEFKEETDSEGNRKGQYSYYDPTGKKITVQYTAGKNGFQVSGDHLPKAPQPLAAPVASAPQYNSQPQYNAIPQSSYTGEHDDGQYRPELYEHQYRYQGEGQRQQQPTNYNQQQQQQPANYNSQRINYNQQPNPQAASFNQFGFRPQPAQVFTTTTTTPSPARFFPRGKLDLNRTPDGYQYSFSSL